MLLQKWPGYILNEEPGPFLREVNQVVGVAPAAPGADVAVGSVDEPTGYSRIGRVGPAPHRNMESAPVVDKLRTRWASSHIGVCVLVILEFHKSVKLIYSTTTSIHTCSI